MSLYREAGGGGPGRLLVAGVVGLVIGVSAGLLLASGGDDEPSVEDAVAAVQDGVSPAVSELELVSIEYREAVRNGEVVADTEYEAALSHVERAQQSLADSDADVLAPAEAAEAEACLEGLLGELESRSESAAVDETVRSCEAAIRRAARL